MVTARERVARAWHDGSDHAAETPFGGPLCNCWRAAERMLPMLRDAWADAVASAYLHETEHFISIKHEPNPYLEDRHVDQ